MDRKLMEKERARLQAALDSYNVATSLAAPDEKGDPDRPIIGQHHQGLRQRIANLDRRLAQADDI